MHLLVSSAYGHNVPSLMFDLLKIHVEVCCEEKLCILIKLVLQGSSITVPPLKNDLSVSLKGNLGTDVVNQMLTGGRQVGEGRLTQDLP